MIQLQHPNTLHAFSTRHKIDKFKEDFNKSLIIWFLLFHIIAWQSKTHEAAWKRCWHIPAFHGVKCVPSSRLWLGSPSRSPQHVCILEPFDECQNRWVLSLPGNNRAQVATDGSPQVSIWCLINVFPSSSFLFHLPMSRIELHKPKVRIRNHQNCLIDLFFVVSTYYVSHHSC